MNTKRVAIALSKHCNCAASYFEPSTKIQTASVFRAISPSYQEPAIILLSSFSLSTFCFFLPRLHLKSGAFSSISTISTLPSYLRSEVELSIMRTTPSSAVWAHIGVVTGLVAFETRHFLPFHLIFLTNVPASITRCFVCRCHRV